MGRTRDRRTVVALAMLCFVVTSAPPSAARDRCRDPDEVLFTRCELTRLLREDDSTHLLGGGIASDEAKSGRFLLTRARNKDRRSAPILLSSINDAIPGGGKPIPPGSRTRAWLRTLSAEFATLAPENAIAHYVLAYVAMLDDDAPAALARLREGNDAPVLETHTRERFDAIVAASRAAGTDSTIASSRALGTLVPTHVLASVRSTCWWLRQGPMAGVERDTCLLAGRRIDDEGRTLLESLFGVNVQRIALGRDGDRAARAERKRIRRRDRDFGKLLKSTRRRCADIPTGTYVELMMSDGEESTLRAFACLSDPASRLCPHDWSVASSRAGG